MPGPGPEEKRPVMGVGIRPGRALAGGSHRLASIPDRPWQVVGEASGEACPSTTGSQGREGSASLKGWVGCQGPSQAGES